MKIQKLLFLCIIGLFACVSHVRAQVCDTIINNVCYNKIYVELSKKSTSKTVINRPLPLPTPMWKVVGVKDKAIDKVTIKDSILHLAVYSISSNAFSNCEINSIQIPSTIEIIGNSAFKFCKNLKFNNLPKYLETIGDSAFYGCTNLDTLQLNNELKSIGNYAFDNSSLKVLSAEGAFMEQISIGKSERTDIDFIYNPKGLKEIYGLRNIFGFCNSTTWIMNQEEDCPSDVLYSKNIKYLKIKGNIEKLPYGTLRIGQLSTLELLDSIQVIKDGAIGGEISNIIISSKLKRIEDGAFADLKSLRIINIPSTVNYIGKRAFAGCDSLESITLPGSITNLNDSTFYKCAFLSSVTLGDGIKTIGYGAFAECDSLKKFKLSSTLESIGDYAFYKCSSLKTITIPEKVKSIGNWAFRNCSTLDNIILPPNITTISEGTFCGCSNLRRITIPQSVVSIDGYAFEGCSALEDVILPPDIKQISEHTFRSCSNLKSINIPESVNSIGVSAFEVCSALENIVFPQSLSLINYCAFYGCKSLTSIDIPAKIEYIGNGAFYGCTNLTDVLFKNNSIPYIYRDAFENTKISSAAIELSDLNVTQKKISFVLDFDGDDALYLSNDQNIQTLKKGINRFVVPTKGSVKLYGYVIIDNKLCGYYSREIEAHGYNPQIESSLHPFTCRFKGKYTLEDGDKPSESFSWGYYTDFWFYGEGHKKYKREVGNSKGNEVILDDYSDQVTLKDPTQFSYETFVNFYVTYNLSSGESKTIEFSYPELSLETVKEAKSVSNTTAIICANTNLDDLATNAGFEWRRYDAPELVPSSRANCPVIDGVMMGALKNLSANTYYKFRPYCIKRDGTEQYGEWSAFGTADAYVYFDPTVRTYNVTNIGDNQVTVKGFAVAGSDPITEQGFEYWETSISEDSAIKKLLSESNKHIVIAEGQWMTATLDNLNEGKKYAVRAFIKTAKETTYGETQTFTTTNTTGIGKVFESNNSLDLRVISQSHNAITINIEGVQDEGKYQMYNLKGLLVCNGIFNTASSIQQIATPNLLPGLYLLKVTDCKHCKTIRVIIK